MIFSSNFLAFAYDSEIRDISTYFSAFVSTSEIIFLLRLFFVILLWIRNKISFTLIFYYSYDTAIRYYILIILPLFHKYELFFRFFIGICISFRNKRFLLLFFHLFNILFQKIFCYVPIIDILIKNHLFFFIIFFFLVVVVFIVFIIIVVTVVS